MTQIQKIFFEKQDNDYRLFISRLNPDLPLDSFIGVRVPEIRQIAKNISFVEAKKFMKKLPHQYYEENLLHAFLIQKIKNFDDCIKEVELFLPYIDNWATSDTMSPKCFFKNHDILINHVYSWINSEYIFTIRFGVWSLMTHYLDKDFKKEYLYLPLSITNNAYYVKMMIAWYYATALAKQYDITFSFMKEKKLSKWIHNKAIQKACESYRIREEHKDFIKSLKY